MASGIELEIAQCIVDATYVLDIVFNCSAQEYAREIGSQIGFDTVKDWPLFRNLGLFHLEELETRRDVLIAMRDQFYAVGMDWGVATADRVVSNPELLQVKMLEVYNQIPSETFAGFAPSDHHREAAKATMNLHGITTENYSNLQIAEYMDFSKFEKLLSAMNAVYGDFSKSLISEAQQVIESESSQ